MDLKELDDLVLNMFKFSPNEKTTLEEFAQK